MRVEEFHTLEKYKELRKVEPMDEKILENFSLIGWILWGLNIEKNYETAVLSEDAKFLLERRYKKVFEK